MSPFLKFFLLAGVVAGAVTTLSIIRPISESPVAQLSPVEREQLRNQIRHRDPTGRGTAAPAMTPATTGEYEFRSGLSLEERQALREQVRGVNPSLRFDGGAMSESVAVNESYPDGVSNPVIDRGGLTGSDR